MVTPKRIEISYEFNENNTEIIKDCIHDLTINGWIHVDLEEMPNPDGNKKIKLVFATENKKLIERILLNPIK